MAYGEDPVDVTMWTRRIRAAQALAALEKPVWDTLEAAVDGIYPNLLPPEDGEGDDYYQALNHDRFRSGDQLDVNLMGRALRYKIAEAYDRFPTLRFTRKPTTDQDAVSAMVKLADKLLDEGDAVTQCRRGMELSYTRGQSIVWPMFIRNTVQESEVVAGKTTPVEYVEAVLHGAEPFVPLGADYAGIIAACKTALAPVDEEGRPRPEFFQMPDEIRDNIVTLQVRAERAERKQKQAPQPLTLRSKIHYECTPYGTFCLTDSGVTDFSRVSWIDRIFVMTPEEFRANPTFTDEAKRDVRPAPLPTSDGGVPVVSTGSETTKRDGDQQQTIDMEGRVTVHEIWDKIGCRRIYIVLGYDKPVGKSTRYPYMDDFGRPLFPDFFPCAWRTPWSRQQERPSRVLGLPGLEPMWAPQIEYIKTISAFVTACKSTARTAVVGPGVDQSTLTAWSRAQDGAIIKMSSDYSPQMHGEPAKQFTWLPMPSAPMDYLAAARLVKAEAFEAVAITSASMTGQPQAGTASQEQLIAQGAATTAGDVKATFEDQYAELALKSLMLFLEFANKHEIEAYLGPEALVPRPPNSLPVQDPATGEMIPAPPRPSIYEAMTSTDLLGERMEARFASSTRAQDFMRIKTLNDLLATVNLVRDGAGIPYKDPRELIDLVADACDVEVGPYHPTEGEIAMQVAAMVSNRGIAGKDAAEDATEPPEDPSKPHADSRKANGQRGTPNSPGAQSRGRSPFAQAGASGNQLRRANNPRT